MNSKESWRGQCPGMQNHCFRFPSVAHWTSLGVVLTSTCALDVITLLICDEVIWFCFLGLVIHFANLLFMFEVTTLARWISLTANVASKQLPGLCSSIGVTAKCFATKRDLINFALLASRLTRANQRQKVKCEKCHRHLSCSRPNFQKRKKQKLKESITLGLDFHGNFWLLSF